MQDTGRQKMTNSEAQRNVYAVAQNRAYIIYVRENKQINCCDAR